MAQFTLDDIRDAVENKYASTSITLESSEVVTLRNPIRMSHDERFALQDGLKDDGVTLDDDEAELTPEQQEAKEAETLNRFAEIVRICVGHDAPAERLLAVEFTPGTPLRDDLAVLSHLVETHLQGAQVGEASASQS